MPKSVWMSVIQIYINDSFMVIKIRKMHLICQNKMIEQILWYAIIIWLLARNNAVYSAVVTELMKELVSPFSPSNWFTRVEDSIIRSYQDINSHISCPLWLFPKRSYIYDLYVLSLSIFQTIGVETLKDRYLDLSGINCW